MKVYLAAPYALRDVIQSHRQGLENNGYTCTSTWLDATHKIDRSALGTSPGSSDDYARTHVKQDIEDVLRSDALVLFTWEMSQALVPHLGPNSGGRHVETGVALSHNIPVIVLGLPENIFHRGDGVVCVGSWWGVINQLNSITA